MSIGCVLPEASDLPRELDIIVEEVRVHLQLVDLWASVLASGDIQVNSTINI